MEKRKGKKAAGRDMESKRMEAERVRLRAKIITLRGLLPDYSGRTIENVLQGLEAIYDFRYGNEE